MPKANERDIYEVRPWLNDDVQNREGLKKIVEGGGSDITVEAVTFTENGTFTAPSGKAYSPVTVNVAGGSSDFSTAEVTLNLTLPEGVTADVEYLATCLLPYPDLITAPPYTSEFINAENHVVVLPMYQGKAYFLMPAANANDVSYIITDPSDVVLSGSVVFDEQSQLFYVTGDCTITATLALGE